MHCTISDYPTDWNDARIYILSDLHIGDPNCDVGAVFERVKTIQDDPHGLCVLNGDLMNTAVRNGVSDIYGEILSPMEQINYCVELLTPIKDRIIAADTGNHENRTYKNDGIDMMRMVCRELGVESRYSPEGVLCFLRFGSGRSHRKGKKVDLVQYVIYATHGTGGGRKEGAKAIRLADMAGVVDADIYIHSHSHLPFVMKESFFRVNPQNKAVTQVDKLFVNDASSLNYGGYGQAQEYKPNSKKSPVISLSGVAREMCATL